jgi:hypothetical protein
MQQSVLKRRERSNGLWDSRSAPQAIGKPFSAKRRINTIGDRCRFENTHAAGRRAL